MPYYATYDTTRLNVKGLFCLDDTHNTTEFIVANTPAGCSALPISDAQAIQISQGKWAVSSGDKSFFELQPTADEQLANAKTLKSSDIEGAYMQAKTDNVTYNGKHFFADMGSQQTFAHALLVYSSLGATPPGFFVMTADYEAVPMSLTDLKALTAAFAQQVWSAFQRYVAAKQALGQATTVPQVQAITF